MAPPVRTLSRNDSDGWTRSAAGSGAIITSFDPQSVPQPGGRQVALTIDRSDWPMWSGSS